MHLTTNIHRVKTNYSAMHEIVNTIFEVEIDGIEVTCVAFSRDAEIINTVGENGNVAIDATDTISLIHFGTAILIDRAAAVA